MPEEKEKRETDAWDKDQKRYEKLQKAIEKKDTKALDSYVDWFLGRSKKDEWL